ncbi:hypothetical protein AVEN_56974-1 [Araneus ventricosus]|uniref:Helitron helicase-like domain-containing protein n=1 Tax=Araneus ventricosus TaxID=182803 RepID=A0A4Y2W2L8_ARAVE|nr:hypothetical protein AVEN_56974-1 [Araneus ventricosus]
MPKRKRGITGDAASRREAIRKRERRVVETEEERSRRLQLWHNVARREERKRSIGAQIVPSTERGAYCFRIHGQIYHRTFHLHPAEAGGENTNTTHFNNIITHIRHVTSGIIRFSPCNAGPYS